MLFMVDMSDTMGKGKLLMMGISDILGEMFVTHGGYLRYTGGYELLMVGMSDTLGEMSYSWWVCQIHLGRCLLLTMGIQAFLPCWVVRLLHICYIAT